MIFITVEAGEVKYKPGGAADSASTILTEGDMISLRPLDDAPTHPSVGAPLPAEPAKIKAWVHTLVEFMSKQIGKDKSAPIIGSASRPGHTTGGEFTVSTDEDPVLVREYSEAGWVDHVVTEERPLTLKTIEANAITAAIYGVAAP
jgi:hypothetical protein